MAMSIHDKVRNMACAQGAPLTADVLLRAERRQVTCAQNDPFSHWALLVQGRLNVRVAITDCKATAWCSCSL